MSEKITSVIDAAIRVIHTPMGESGIQVTSPLARAIFGLAIQLADAEVTESGDATAGIGIADLAGGLNKLMLSLLDANERLRILSQVSMGICKDCGNTTNGLICCCTKN